MCDDANPIRYFEWKCPNYVKEFLNNKLFEKAEKQKKRKKKDMDNTSKN